MDINKLMQMAGQMQAQVQQAQQEAASMRFEGEAGGGLVRVTVDGGHRLVALKIDPKAVDVSDLTLLEDLVRAAVNQASERAGAELKNRLGGMAQGMGVDLGALGLGDLTKG